MLYRISITAALLCCVASAPTVRRRRTDANELSGYALQPSPPPPLLLSTIARASSRVVDEKCAAARSCGGCVNRKSCGWCPVLSLCLDGDRLGPSGANCTFWAFEDCESGCGDYLDCTTCAADDECGWCMDSCTCVQGGRGGPAYGTCSDGWHGGGDGGEAMSSSSCPAPGAGGGVAEAMCDVVQKRPGELWRRAAASDSAARDVPLGTDAALLSRAAV